MPRSTRFTDLKNILSMHTYLLRLWYVYIFIRKFNLMPIACAWIHFHGVVQQLLSASLVLKAVSNSVLDLDLLS